MTSVAVSEPEKGSAAVLVEWHDATVHYRDASSTWQTHEAKGHDSIHIDCLDGFDLTLDAI